MIVGLVTTRDEAPTIGPLVSALHDICARVDVVDEWSTDDTAILASRAGAHVWYRRGGIGPCLQYGWRMNCRPFVEMDRLVQIDAGGSHDPLDAKRLLDVDADIVIGSRFVRGAHHDGAWWRQIGSRAYGLMWRWKTGHGVNDWTSGYRVFSRHAATVLADINCRATMHGFQAEILARAFEHGLTVAEVPITYRTSDSSLSPRVVREAFRVWWEHR